MNTSRFSRRLALCAMALCATALAVASGTARAQSVPPVLVSGNPNCSAVGYDQDFSFKIDGGPYDGTHTILIDGNAVGEVTVHNPPDGNPDNHYFTWESTLAMNAVIAKGGDAANVYHYDPSAYEDLTLPGLVPPVNASGFPAAISHIEFCIDPALQIDKSAETSFTRTYAWTVDKDGDQTAILINDGDSFLVNYTVTVDVSGYGDSDWAVSGDITIHNPWPDDATVTGVSDEMTGGLVAAVTCPDPFPFVVGAGDTVTCTYESDLPDGTDRTNTATVTTSGDIDGGTATADVLFGDPTTVVDDCVDLSDSLYGDLGTVCVDDAPDEFQYQIDVGAVASERGDCGDVVEVTNTATATGDDTADTASDDHTVVVTLADCQVGCSLTLGYWKTHSEYGPAPYDDAWALLPDGADTPLFATGLTWYAMFWTPPGGGNAYVQLAHQWMAATLNGLNGADISIIDGGPGDVNWNGCTDGTLSCAAALLDQYDTVWNGNIPANIKTRMRNMAGRLGSYNEGEIGPGHCDESPLENPSPTDAEAPPAVPETYDLTTPYPNPFRAATTLRVDLPEAADVTVVVYDVLGREVARLVDGHLPAGEHTVRWEAQGAPSGTYIVVLQAGTVREARTVVLAR